MFAAQQSLNRDLSIMKSFFKSLLFFNVLSSITFPALATEIGLDDVAQLSDQDFLATQSHTKVNSPAKGGFVLKKFPSANKLITSGEKLSNNHLEANSVLDFKIEIE